MADQSGGDAEPSSAAVLLADRGVLLAGDMLSNVLIPLFDPRRPDRVGAYERALDRLGEAARHVDVLVPATAVASQGRPRSALGWVLRSSTW